MAENGPGGRLTGRHSKVTGTAGGPPTEPLPDDQQALAEDIERTREELGATVEALAAKADVKARAREKAAEMSGRLTGAAGQAGAQLSAGTRRLRNEAAGSLATAKRTILNASGPVRQQVSRAGRTGTTVWQAAPEPVQRTAKRAASGAQRRRVPLAVATSAVLLAGLIMVWRRR
jgi:Protein of unknown function (DUF3618)